MNLNLGRVTEHSARTYQVVDDESDNEVNDSSKVNPEFRIRETKCREEEFKKNVDSENKQIDPNKKYKRVLKRVKYDGRGSVSSFSSLQSDYKTVRSDEEDDRPSIFDRDDVYKISEKSEVEENNSNEASAEKHAELPQKSKKYLVVES